MKKIAVIGAILEQPQVSQKRFNEIVSNFKGMIKGRMGIPFDNQDIAVISLVVEAELDDINNLTGKLGRIEHTTVKTTISGNINDKVVN